MELERIKFRLRVCAIMGGLLQSVCYSEGYASSKLHFTVWNEDVNICDKFFPYRATSSSITPNSKSDLYFSPNDRKEIYATDISIGIFFNHSASPDQLLNYVNPPYRLFLPSAVEKHNFLSINLDQVEQAGVIESLSIVTLGHEYNPIGLGGEYLLSPHKPLQVHSIPINKEELENKFLIIKIKKIIKDQNIYHKWTCSLKSQLD